MKRLTTALALTILATLTTACGNTASFSKAGDETPGDLGGDPVTPPCDVIGNCDDDGGGPNDPPIGTIVEGSDVFFQSPKDGRVDILIISDNSGSMAEEQKKMGSRFSSFISGIKDLDWQIGVTTTDVSDGPWGVKGGLVDLTGHPGSKILTPRFADAGTVFTNTVTRQETIDCELDPSFCPSGDEQPLYSTVLAIEKRTTVNRGFFRSASDLAVVVLSDEDERSDGSQSTIRPQDVIAKHRSVWGAEKKVSFYGIVIEPGNQACMDSQLKQTGGTAHYGRHVSELARLSGGVTGNICENDYSSTLAKISDRVRELYDSFELAHVPEAGSVTVKVTPNQPVTWKVNGNKLIFTPPPAFGSKVEVSYKYKK